MFLCRRYFAIASVFLGCPAKPDEPWTAETLGRLADLGFNAIQLNIAWGCRPGDEPLNLEDVVDYPAPPAAGTSRLPPRSGCEPAQIERRRADLRDRIDLCRRIGLRTLFHFGAPYNMHARFGDSPPNCLSDPALRSYYAKLLELFCEQFPGVDDLLLYTYDQDARTLGCAASSATAGAAVAYHWTSALPFSSTNWPALGPVSALRADCGGNRGSCRPGRC